MSVEEMPRPSSWVVEIEKYMNAGDAGGDSPGAMPRGPEGRHCIYRVPEYVKKMTNSNAYRPQVVSLGPFHHGVPALLPMEKHKCRATANMVNRSGKTLEEFIAAVEEIKEQLMDAYENLDDKWRHGTSFVEMMLNDGCFLLEMGIILQIIDDGGTVKNYGPNDPVFSKHGFLYLAPSIRADVVLMENQLPLLLLQKLVDFAYPDNTFEKSGLKSLNNWVIALHCSSISNNPLLEDDNDHLGLHPLDVLQKSTRGKRPDRRSPEVPDFVMECATKLYKKGIHFKLSDAEGLAGGVTFKGGVLYIPQITLNDDAELIFLNLMAFERLHPDAGNEVTAFVFFMDLLIDTAKDVALLSSKKIIENCIGNDEVAADLFSKILTKGTIVSDDSTFWDVLREVNAHCKKRRNRWRAILVQKHFSNPWVFISLVAAIILLIATVMQTVYTIVPFYKNK